MVWLKANPKLEQTYRKIIESMKADVKWDGVFIIKNNSIILQGEINSFIFDFELRRAYSNIIDIPDTPQELFEIGERKLLINILNMILYVFGKWKTLPLKVSQDYMQIDALLKNILKEINIVSYYSPSGIKFVGDGLQIVFEDIIVVAVDRIKQLESEEENPIEEDEEEGSQGLWHDIKWKISSAQFDKRNVTKVMSAANRIGNNFYMVSYICPECNNNLHMIVYPDNKEFRIDTDDGKVYIARAYCCPECSKFYTPRPEKLLAEGDIYVLDFDDDKTATEDYRKLIGVHAKKTSNSNFNLYEDDYLNRRGSKGKDLSYVRVHLNEFSDEELERIRMMMDEGFYDERAVERFLAIIEQELAYRKSMRHKTEKEFDRDANEDDNEENTADNEEGIFGKPSEVLEEDGIDRDDINTQDKTKNKGIFKKRRNASKSDKKEKSGRKKILNENKVSERKNKEYGMKNTIGNESAYNSMQDGINNDVSLNNKNKHDIKSVHDNVQNNENLNDTKKGVYGDTHDGGNLNNEIGTHYNESLYNGGSAVDDEYENDSEGIINIEYKNGSEGITNTEYKNGSEVVTDTEYVNDNYSVEEDKRTENERDILGKEEQISQKNVVVTVEDFEKKVAESIGKKYSDIASLLREIENSNLDDGEKEKLSTKLKKELKVKGNKELDYIVLHLPQNDSKDRYKRVKEKIKSYSDIDTSRYEDIIDKHIDRAEMAELNSIVDKIKLTDRKALIDAIKNIKGQGFEQRNAKQYTDKLHDKIVDIDNETVSKICPDLYNLDVESGIKAMKEIEAADILPEIKSNTLELIDKRLTRMKADECEQLVEKLKKNLTGNLKDNSRIHFYDIRKMQGGENKDAESLIIRKAVSTYAILIGKYEYPVVICDSSLSGNGKQGFIITPDHIFYKGFLKSGVIDVMNIEKISIDKAKGGKGICALHSSGTSYKLPCTLNNKEEESLAEVIDEFVNYLKSKPQSRSIEYLSQEKHAVKCCYRCGHKFAAGNVCPKCGSRN